MLIVNAVNLYFIKISFTQILKVRYNYYINLHNIYLGIIMTDFEFEIMLNDFADESSIEEFDNELFNVTK